MRKTYQYFIVLLFLLVSICASGVDESEIPTPELPTEDMVEKDENGNTIGFRTLEKNTTVYLDSQVNVYVPLEIISDVDIDALVIDDSQVRIPFKVELNRNPEKQNYFKLRYSETEIDIDKDGQTDTYIYSSPFLNNKIEENNIVCIEGKNISREGKFEKVIYMTIEVRE